MIKGYNLKDWFERTKIIAIKAISKDFMNPHYFGTRCKCPINCWIYGIITNQIAKSHNPSVIVLFRLGSNKTKAKRTDFSLIEMTEDKLIIVVAWQDTVCYELLNLNTLLKLSRDFWCCNDKNKDFKAELRCIQTHFEV